MTTLLVDGDVLAYFASQHNEVCTEVEPGYYTWYCDFNKVIDTINWDLGHKKKRLEAKKYILCLTDYERNFRKDILSTYKGNRSNLKKPLVLKPTREYLLNKKGAIIMPGLEGDDVMGILSGEDTIIVSIDKDMKTIPGRYYNPNEDAVIDISVEEADYWHLYQTLIGDAIDGYSGCPTIGKVTAKKLLDKSPTWATVVDTYKKQKLTEEYALQQARCARILRPSDYNKETGEPILWTPER